jgi:hypothetical protein
MNRQMSEGSQCSEGRMGRRLMLRLLPLLPLLSLLPSCSSGDRLVTISGTGVVRGIVYKDLDGDRLPASTDAALQGVGVRLIVGGTLDTLAKVTSDANGQFSFGAVPVGRYAIAVPDVPSIFGDSLQVVRIDTADFSLGVDDSSDVVVSVSFPARSIVEARALPVGQKIFVAGLALSSSTTFGDTAFSLADTSGIVRITGVSGPLVAAGDSIRVLGTTSARDGQPVIADGHVTLLGIANLPVAEQVTTVQAATADAGRLDAGLVKIVDGTISDTTTSADSNYVATVNDGTGPVLVVFDRHASLTRTPYVPGVVIDATGVLLPDGAGGWVLKPRSNNDVVKK